MTHLMIDFMAATKNLASEEVIKALLYKIPEVIGVERLIEPVVTHFDDANGHGAEITGFVVIAEGHISIWTYPETQQGYLDILSNKSFDDRVVLACVGKYLNTYSASTRFFERMELGSAR